MLKRTYLKLVEMQEEQARRHLDEVRSIHSEMRGYKHDFHHHLQALKGQLEAGEVERAIAYITELDRSLQSVDTLLKTGNVTVDAILSAKLAQARADGIAVTVDVNLPDRLTFSDLELSIVIGNLLDNAIEACREAQGEKFIRLSMRIKGKMLYFYLLNAAGSRKTKIGSLFRTGQSGRTGCSAPPRRTSARTASACTARRPFWSSMAAGSNTTVRTARSPRNFWFPPSRNCNSCTDRCSWCTNCAFRHLLC